MLPYLDHHDFVGARKALILISISIIIFSKLEIASDKLLILGVTVKTDGINFPLISGIFLTYFLFNYFWRLMLHVSRRNDENAEEYLKSVRPEAPFVKDPPSNRVLIDYLKGDISRYDESRQEQLREFRASSKVARAERIKRTQNQTLLIFDVAIPSIVCLWAYRIVLGFIL